MAAMFCEPPKHLPWLSGLIFASAAFWSAGCWWGIEPTPCGDHDDCCVDGPAYMCVQGECEYDERIADDPTQYEARRRACEQADE